MANLDSRGVPRGECNQNGCSCPAYDGGPSGKKCVNTNCGHFPGQHKKQASAPPEGGVWVHQEQVEDVLLSQEECKDPPNSNVQPPLEQVKDELLSSSSAQPPQNSYDSKELPLESLQESTEDILDCIQICEAVPPIPKNSIQLQLPQEPTSLPEVCAQESITDISRVGALQEPAEDLQVSSKKLPVIPKKIPAEDHVLLSPKANSQLSSEKVLLPSESGTWIPQKPALFPKKSRVLPSISQKRIPSWIFQKSRENFPPVMCGDLKCEADFGVQHTNSLPLSTVGGNETIKGKGNGCLGD